MPVKRRKLQPIAPPIFEKIISEPSTFPIQRLLRISQVAAYLGCSVWAVRDLLRRKELTKIPLGRKFLVDRNQVDAYIERVKARAAA